jgi:hypothetical protein
VGGGDNVESSDASAPSSLSSPQSSSSDVELLARSTLSSGAPDSDPTLLSVVALSSSPFSHRDSPDQQGSADEMMSEGHGSSNDDDSSDSDAVSIEVMEEEKEEFGGVPLDGQWEGEMMVPWSCVNVWVCVVEWLCTIVL